LGIVFQDFQLLTDRTVRDNLKFVLKATGWKDKALIDDRIEEVLKEVDMEGKGYKMPNQLSGGEQQRIVIARAILNKPDIILADEPTGNLDSRASHIIMEELQEIHSLGNTIIMVTHNPALTTYATRVINMLDGEIDTDIKTVADQDLPQPGDPEKISVRVLSKKRPVELEVESQTKVIVSGKNVTIDEPKVSEKLAKPTALDEENTAKRETKREETKKKTHAKRSRITSILNKAKEKAKVTVKGKSKVKLPSKDKTKSKTKAKTTKKGKEA
jgi:ABC-type methionine transport system ATPase subunit